MKSFKRILRLSGFVLLIVLASVGVGFAGGVPIPSSNKKEDTIEIAIELVESQEDETTLHKLEIKE
jgi:hypothetical protein